MVARPTRSSDTAEVAIVGIDEGEARELALAAERSGLPSARSRSGAPSS
jgi:hypothetical protein